MEFVASSEYDGEEHATSTMEKVRGEEDPAWLQGDMDMYSPANQKKRKRLKHDPAVQVCHLPLSVSLSLPFVGILPGGSRRRIQNGGK